MEGRIEYGKKVHVQSIGDHLFIPLIQHVLIKKMEMVRQWEENKGNQSIERQAHEFFTHRREKKKEVVVEMLPQMVAE